MIAGRPKEAAVRAFVEKAFMNEISRTASSETEREGIFTGVYAVHPFTELVPVWVANYVLYEYGTQALSWACRPMMNATGFPLSTVCRKSGGTAGRAGLFRCGFHRPCDGTGVLVDSGRFSGLSNEAAKSALHFLAGRPGVGTRRSIIVCVIGGIRQRYWGALFL